MESVTCEDLFLSPLGTKCPSFEQKRSSRQVTKEVSLSARRGLQLASVSMTSPDSYWMRSWPDCWDRNHLASVKVLGRTAVCRIVQIGCVGQPAYNVSA